MVENKDLSLATFKKCPCCLYKIFKCSFSHLKTSNFKIFSNRGGEQRLVFGHICGIFLLIIEYFHGNLIWMGSRGRPKTSIPNLLNAFIQFGNVEYTLVRENYILFVAVVREKGLFFQEKVRESQGIIFFDNLYQPCWS